MQVKTQYDSRPETIGFYPTDDGVTVRFRENIEEVINDEDSKWEADEYSLFLPKCNEALARKRVGKNEALFLAQAKENAQDVPVEPDVLELMADHEERICLLELGVVIE